MMPTKVLWRMKYSRAERLSCATRLVVRNPSESKVQKAKVASTTDLRPIVLILIATIPGIHCANAFLSAELLALHRTAEKWETDALWTAVAQKAQCLAVVSPQC
jgi:hypothetical protein